MFIDNLIDATVILLALSVLFAVIAGVGYGLMRLWDRRNKRRAL